MQQMGATNFDDNYQSLIKSLDKQPSVMPKVPEKYQYDQYEDNFEKKWLSRNSRGLFFFYSAKLYPVTIAG